MLVNQKILVVGGSGDIGKAMLSRFLADEAVVFATYNNHPEALAAFSQNPNFSAVRMDVTNLASVEAAYEEIQTKGSLDSLVYNAGITRDNLLLGLEEKDWLEVIETNLNGAFRVARTFGKIFFRKKAGKMLFISSVAGTHGGRGQSNYAASKAGLEALVRSLAVEMAPRGVLVNAIAPGPIESKMTKDVMNLASEEVLRRIPLHRLGKPEEIAAFTAHFLSPEISWVTGQTFAIDGGFGL